MAAQALSRVPAAKRGEVLVMQWLGMLDGQTRPSTSVKNTYNNIFMDQLNPSHTEAMRQLFPEAGQARRRTSLTPWQCGMVDQSDG